MDPEIINPVSDLYTPPPDAAAQAQADAAAKFSAESAARQKAESELAAANSTTRMLLENLNRIQAQQAPQPQQPAQQQFVIPPGMDEETGRAIQTMLNGTMNPLQQQLAQLAEQNRQLAAQLGQQQFQAAGQQIADPEIQQKAQQLLQNWQARNMSGWTPDDALTYAAGQKYLAQIRAGQSQKTERGQFNGAANGTLTGQSGVPNVQVQQQVDVQSLPLDKQIEFYEKKLGNSSF